MTRPLTITSSSPWRVPSPIELRAASVDHASRQRRSTLRWLAVAWVCATVAVGLAVGWGLS